ncbi:MAG TPA: nuclear transport factor 2 family protein [Tepidisphaeraceae bacterium]|jgi:ketosteroid isomerase-like protein
MIDATDPKAADRIFFRALLDCNVEVLEQLLADDFTLIDVMSGGENTKTALLAAVGAGQVRFESIEPEEIRVRTYGNSAVVGGRTRIKGTLGDTSFTVASRYVHVYVRQDSHWQLVWAQGTPITGG